MPSIEGRHDGRRILLPIAVLGSRDPTDLTHRTYQGLLDTGATASWITPRVVADLDLHELGKAPVSVATEIRQAKTYVFRLGLHHALDESTLPYVFAEITGFRMTQRDNFDVLLGMDVLRHTDFAMRRDGTWTLSFGI